jgi:hypothetical protein
VQIVSDILKGMNLDTEVETPGRKIVRHTGNSLVQAMEMALPGPGLAAAQIVAAECVTLAETKDHLNWGLIGEIGKNSNGDAAVMLKRAHDQVEPEEDEHLCHTSGWTLELWIEAVGMPAVLPPPEEQQDVNKPMNMSIPGGADPRKFQPKRVAQAIETSPTLSVVNKPNFPKDTIKTRKIAVLLADGFDDTSVREMSKALLTAGAMPKTVAPGSEL